MRKEYITMKRFFLVLGLLSMFLISCGKGGDLSKTLIMNLKEEGKSYDPQLANDSTGEFVDSLIGESLTRPGEDGKPVPGVAEKWDVSDDGLVWTFNLRKNAKWSNGDPITANDFKAGWLRGLDPATASEYAKMLYPIKNAEEYNSGKAKAEDVGIEVKDDYTLIVTLKAPLTYFPSMVQVQTYLPLNKKFYDTVKEKYVTSPETTISSGPYILKKWTRNSSIIFEKNPNYWNKDAVKLERVEVKFIKDADPSLNAFKNGEIDMTNITTEQAKEFKNSDEAMITKDGSVWYMTYNMKNKVLSNKKIRQALSLSINKEEMVQKVLDNRGKAAYTYTVKDSGIIGVDKDFAAEAGDIFPKYNPEEAKKLFAEGMKELGISQFPKLEMIFNDSGNNKVISVYIQESLRNNLGIDLEITGMGLNDRLARMQQKNYDIALAGFAGDYADAISYLERFQSKHGNNYSQYVNPKYDQLVEFVTTSSDQKARVAAMIEMEKIIADDMPVGILYFRENVKLLKKRVKGMVLRPIGIDYGLEKVYIQE